MKFLKGLANTILVIILSVLLFALSMTFVLKKFVQEDLVVTMAKDEIVTKYIDSDKSGIDEDKRAIVKDLLNGKDANELLNVMMDNYILYSISDNYELSKSDYNKALKFLEDHVESINKLSSEDIDINYIKEHFTYEETNKIIKEEFNKLEAEMSDSSLDPEEVTRNVNIINLYANMVSNQTRMYILSGIGVVILLLMFINWSVSKWMVEAGISLILSGALVTMVYNFFLLIKESISADGIEYFDKIDLKYAIILGACEVILGIAIIIIKSKIEKLEIENSVVEMQGTKENME